MYILLSGQIKILKNERAESLKKGIRVINSSLLYAVTAIPADHSVLVIGDAIFLELALEDILETKKSIRI